MKQPRPWGVAGRRAADRLPGMGRLLAAAMLLAASGALSANAAAGTTAADGRGDSRLARAASRCIKLGELISCYDALNLKPNSPDLLVAEADALVQLKRPGEAVGVYRNALRRGADRASVDARIARALALRRTMLDACLGGEGPAALHACEAAWLPGAPDEVTVFKRRGFLLQSANQPSSALDAYLAAARLRPGDRDVARAIVSLCARTGRRDAAALTALGRARARLRGAEPAPATAPAPTAAPSPAAAADETEVAGSPSHFSNQAEITRSN